MKRSELIEVATAAARSCGYTLCEGPLSMASRLTGCFPAAWLTPPTLKSVDGRNRGVMCYHLKIRLMKLLQGLTSEPDISDIREQMQQDALNMVVAMRENTLVCDITGLKCQWPTESTTAARELSMNMEMNLHAYFNINEL